MPANDWTPYALYPPPKGIGGIWSQPGGPGTEVFPTQVRASSAYLSTTPFTELTGVYLGVCQHSFNAVYVFREYNYDTESSVALLCCPLCGCIQRTIEPFEDAVYGNVSSLLNAILYP